ncbi:MAG: glycosyltransferase [Lachnospirales bacterium]
MISLCMIVKNEIKFIERCLENVKDYVDEIIVVDSGSTDGTLDILKTFSCKVYNFIWCDDYAKARNYSISKATNDWILILDGDEIIKNFDKEKVRDFVTTAKGYEIGEIEICSYIESYDKTSTSKVPRFFNKNYYEFERALHERLVSKVNVSCEKIKYLDIEVIHYGYLNEVVTTKDKNKKHIETITKLLNEKYDAYLHKHLISCYYNDKLYEEALREISKFLSSKNEVDYNIFSQVICTNIKIFLAMKKYKEAATLEKYYEQCKNNDEYLFTLAMAYSLVNRREEAIDIQLFLVDKPSLSINKEQPINNIAYILFESGLYEAAIEWFKMLPSTKEMEEIIKFCENKIK